jgi:hypothetical protein
MYGYPGIWLYGYPVTRISGVLNMAPR